MYLIDPIILKRDKFDASGYFGTKKERNIYIYIYNSYRYDTVNQFKKKKIKNKKRTPLAPQIV